MNLLISEIYLKLDLKTIYFEVKYFSEKNVSPLPLVPNAGVKELFLLGCFLKYD